MDNILGPGTPGNLEQLEAKISQQITQVKNEHVKHHLRMMLQDIRKRKEMLRQQARFQFDNPPSEESEVLMLSDEVEGEGFLLNDVIEKADQEASRDGDAVTEQEYAMVKERMKEMAALSRKQTQTFHQDAEERMHFPKIPEIATKEYLEQLENALVQQLEKTKNDKVRNHLNLLLEEIHRRKLTFAAIAQLSQDDNVSAQIETVPSSGNLFDAAQEMPPLPPQTFEKEIREGATARDEVMLKIPETATEDYLDKLEERASEQLQKATDAQTKIRLETLLQEIRRWKPLLSQGIIVEPDQPEPAFIPKHARQGKSILDELEAMDVDENVEAFSAEGSAEINPNIVPQTVTDKHLELLEVKVAQRLRSAKNERVKSLLKRLLQKIHRQREILKQTFQEEIKKSAELSFAEVCLKVMDGETLGLFDHVDLSEREQELITAFLGHLSSVQGIKKQKVYEMQYMTGRSIVELERLFKTYNLQLQGPVYSELSRIFNRLVFLRNQFSLLMR